MTAVAVQLHRRRSKLAKIDAWSLGPCPRFSEADVDALVGAAVGLGAARFGGDLSDAEVDLVSRLIPIPDDTIDHLRDRIAAGEDPLGEVLRNMGRPSTRKLRGVSYTPQHVVDRMINWGKQAGTPTRVVDAGTGSGRFLLSAFRAFGEGVSLVGVDLDPVATLVARANLAAAGARREEVRIRNEDFCRSSLRRQSGTLRGQAGRSWIFARLRITVAAHKLFR